MRKIYLIRHALPDFPGGEKMCIGTTDIPLSLPGRLQSCVMGRELGDRVSRVFSSRLSRAIQTAQYISPDVHTAEGLREMCAGKWDGLSFTRIKEGWPELFRMRGDRYIPPPGAERIEDALPRFEAALRQCLRESEGDIAVVSHNSIIQAFLTSLLPDEPPRYRLRMPYVSYTVVTFDGEFHTCGETRTPLPVLDASLCGQLMDTAVPGNVKEHCNAVADMAFRIYTELNSRGFSLDGELIYRSALLHDIARPENNHPAVGARWLTELGCPREGEIIRQHHDIDYEIIDEAAVVHIADKLFIGARPVTVEERFSGSLEKCKSPEAVATHTRRYETVLKIKEDINTICEKELIP